MKKVIRQSLFLSGILVGCLSIGIAATLGTYHTISQAEAGSYSLTLNSSKAPASLTSSYQDNLTATVTTNNGNSISLCFVYAKASSGNFVELANRGYLYNFGSSTGKFTGITGITATFTGALTVRTSAAELQNGGAFLGSSTPLTSGSKYTVSPSGRYFQLQAGDNGAVISSLKIDYSCDGSAQTITDGQTYYVEDYESYTGDGVGYDNYNGGHAKTATSNLRSEYYARYKGDNNADPLNGSGWNLMGSDDYITYSSNKGRGGTKCALFKVNSGNNFSYFQTKALRQIPSVIGKGNRLSLWMHGGYSDKTATTNSSVDVTVKIMALYHNNFSYNATNAADSVDYVVRAGSAWIEYTLVLDPTKNYYSYGIYIMKASTTVYVPVDDITIKTISTAKTAPDGMYNASPTINNPIGNNFTVPAIISIGRKNNSVGVMFNNSNAQPTGYTYNSSTGAFSITTTGSYTFSGITKQYGTITGTYNSNNDSLTNVKLSGSISDYIQNNGKITMNALPSSQYWNCENTSAMNSVWTRRYKDGNGNWNTDPGNVDRTVLDNTYFRSGNSGLSPRPYSSYPYLIRLTNGFNNTAVSNFGFWVYNPSSTAIKMNLYVFKTTNYDNVANSSDAYCFISSKEFGQGWTFYVVGFRHSTYCPSGSAVKNIALLFHASSTRVTVDDICLFA